MRLYPQGSHVQEAKKYLKEERRKIIIGASAIIGILLLLGFVAMTLQRAREYEPPVSMVKADDTSSPNNQSEENSSSYDNESNSGAVTDDNSNYSVDTNNESSYSTEQESNETTNSYDAYRNNSLRTGDKPYAPYFGKAQSGKNFIDFKTSGSSDYVAIVKRHNNNKYVNHTYIRGGDNARLYVPSGTYDVYFYSGSGWNPNMVVGQFTGGFVVGGTMQKDGPIQLLSETITLDDGSTQLRTAYMEYTLYPVTNGNLVLQSADIDNVLN